VGERFQGEGIACEGMPWAQLSARQLGNAQGVRLQAVFWWTGGESCEVLFGVLSGRRFSQADKCTWWMPWHEPAMKDVASCEKPRGAASEH
jgi:hypothetical protein